jgi:hypothetical protein
MIPPGAPRQRATIRPRLQFFEFMQLLCTRQLSVHSLTNSKNGYLR